MQSYAKCAKQQASPAAHVSNWYDALLCRLLAGDQAMHLLWRLQHGQIFEKHQPKLAFVLIGTNDLGAASCLGGEAAILQAAAGTVER